MAQFRGNNRATQMMQARVQSTPTSVRALAGKAAAAKPKNRRKSPRSQIWTLLLLVLLALNAAVGILVAQSALPANGSSAASIASEPMPADSISVPSNSSSPINESTTTVTATAAEQAEPTNLSQVANKPKPLNWTLVEQEFEAVLSDEQVARKWHLMEQHFSDGIKSALKMIFPQIVAISQDTKVSGDCSGGILKWILNLRNLRSWAIKMLDASGKPTSGIFEGSLSMFGNYRQCLNIRAPDEDEIEITERFEEYFRGQFCVLHLRPWLPAKQAYYHLNTTYEFLQRKRYKYYEKTLYDELADIAVAFQFMDIRIDLCVPSTCSLADIQRVADLLSSKLDMRSKVMRCDVAPRESATSLLIGQLEQPTSYVMLALPATVLALTLLASLVQLLCVRKSTTQSKLTRLLESLSIGSMIKSRHLEPQQQQTKRNDNYPQQHRAESEQSFDQLASMGPSASMSFEAKPLALYGLRNVFVLWFIIVQFAAELKYQFLRESLTLRNLIITYWPFQLLINSGPVFESLIIITAFTLGYTNCGRSTGQVGAYLARKYLRLVVPIATVVVLTIMTPILAIESPVWRNFVDQQATVCKSTGYLDLTFLQNFISYDKMCLPHTWLFCVELQLAILFVPLLWLLKQTFAEQLESSKLTILDSQMSQSKSLSGCLVIKLLCSRTGLLSLSLLVASFAANFLLVYMNHLPPSWFHTFPDANQKNEYFSQYQTKTWTHLGAFLIGIIGGFMCRLRQELQLRETAQLAARGQPSGQPASNNSINESSNGEIGEPNMQGSPTPSMSTIRTESSIKHSKLGSTVAIVPIHHLIDRQVGCLHNADSSADFSEQPAKIKQTLLSIGRISRALIALASMAAIVFSTFEWSTKERPSDLVAATYDSCSRLVWSLALVSLMGQLCAKRPGDSTQFVSSFGTYLAGPSAISLGRLSFLAYLLTPYVHSFVLAVAEQSLFPSLFMIFHLVVGNIVIIYALAFVLAVLVEQPISRLVARLIN